jgi:hypothetical protein
MSAIIGHYFFALARSNRWSDGKTEEINAEAGEVRHYNAPHYDTSTRETVFKCPGL